MPKAIPFAYTSYYKLFEATWGVPITEDINQEIIKVAGLDESQFNENSTTEELKALGAWTGNFKNYFSINESNYGSKKYEVENWAKIRAQEQDARNAAKPVQRTVVIEKQ